MDVVTTEYFNVVGHDRLSGDEFLVTEPNEITSVVSVRMLTERSDQHKSYAIDKRDYDRLLQLHKGYDFAFLVVRWEDAIGIIELPLIVGFKVVASGHSTTDETAIEFPISAFEIVRRF